MEDAGDDNLDNERRYDSTPTPKFNELDGRKRINSITKTENSITLSDKSNRSVSDYMFNMIQASTHHWPVHLTKVMYRQQIGSPKIKHIIICCC